MLPIPQEKKTKWHVRPAKNQSSLCAQWVSKDPGFLHVDREDWSDWADAQADLSFRWVHMQFYSFCHVLAQMAYEQMITLKSLKRQFCQNWFACIWKGDFSKWKDFAPTGGKLYPFRVETPFQLGNGVQESKREVTKVFPLVKYGRNSTWLLTTLPQPI